MQNLLELAEEKIRGTQIAYYIVCKRKLWLFSHNLTFEQLSDYVQIGKLISETTFKREKFKEVALGETIKIDFIKVGDQIIIHEVKKSKKLEEAHIWQVKFYIWSLRNKGINCNKGIIHYPKLLKKLEVELNEEDEVKIKDIIDKIIQIINTDTPPEVINAKYCKRCAYYSFCFI